MELSFKVKAVYDGRRLGDVLTEQELMSTRQKKQVRLYGSALRNGQPHRLIDPVYAGDEITVSDGESPGEVKSGHRFSVLYEDQYFIAVNKPAGLLTHPSIRDDESVLDTLSLVPARRRSTRQRDERCPVARERRAQPFCRLDDAVSKALSRHLSR